MICNEPLSSLLKINNISESALEEKLYHTLILGVFEALCKDILKNNKLVEEKERFRKSSDKVVAAKRLVRKYIGCCLSNSECEVISKYLCAFFSKDDYRKPFETSYKENLLKNQNGECAICKSKIEMSNSHLDHIIPFNYVGDILPSNYQMLCETCNTRKGTSAYFEISMLLLNRK